MHLQLSVRPCLLGTNPNRYWSQKLLSLGGFVLGLLLLAVCLLNNERLRMVSLLIITSKNGVFESVVIESMLALLPEGR